MEVAQVLPDFAGAFAFDEFNEMQREALPALLESESNVVASAPTASGKTALAELAMCKTLQAGGTALFLAPLRALTNEKESEWDRFERLDYSVYVVTGERDLNPRRARRADILVMTPEKLDSATRKYDSRRYAFVTDVDLCVIDEVHLLDADRRGSVLEVTVARLRSLCSPRIVALSATLPNVEDVAAWLDAPPEATFSFGPEYRPVELTAGVKTYTHGDNAFADKYRRLYRTLDLAEPHLTDDGQALVFVASRRDTVEAASKAVEELTERAVDVGSRGDMEFHERTQALDDDRLRDCVLDGVAYHHAGLSRTDRNLIEQWFREGRIGLLFSTTTLAWGVNLPARCVVIRDTKLHDPLEGEIDMSPLDVLQMLGRAGRPEYDDVGYGWVICDGKEADRYRQLLEHGKEIESRLGETLDVHLNAEIAMGTIGGLEDVMAWLETTYYYVRGQSRPDKYNFPGLRGRVRDVLDTLVERGFVTVDEDLAIDPTRKGILTSRYYLELATASRFHDLCEQSVIDDRTILEAVAGASEFEAVSARQGDKEVIDRVLGTAVPDDLTSGQQKVLAILQGAGSGRPITDLGSDAWIIRRNAGRLLSALGAFLDRFATVRASNLARRVEARVEHGVGPDRVGLTAIDGVGPGRANKLVTEGIDSPAAVRTAGADGLEDAGLSAGVADAVLKGAEDLPILEIDWGEFPEHVRRGANELSEVTVRNSGDPARIGIRVTVNDVEMTATTERLGVTTVPIGVFGAEGEERLCFAIEVAPPDCPIEPIRETRTVSVVD